MGYRPVRDGMEGTCKGRFRNAWVEGSKPDEGGDMGGLRMAFRKG